MSEGTTDTPSITRHNFHNCFPVLSKFFIIVMHLDKILKTVSAEEVDSNSNASDFYVGSARFETCPNQ
jgi:ABC-type lipopolysaccharide export system ATPase subunit